MFALIKIIFTDKLMKQIIQIFVLVFCLMTSSHAQFDDKDGWSGEQQAVYETISTLFEGMRNGDKVLIESVFADQNRPLLKVITNDRDQDSAIQLRTAESFIQAAGQQHEKVWDERIWNTTISIDGSLASVWTHYGFYLDNTLQHCGVNSIQLFKSSGMWKIINLAYTRKTTNCKIPERVQNPK